MCRRPFCGVMSKRRTLRVRRRPIFRRCDSGTSSPARRASSRQVASRPMTSCGPSRFWLGNLTSHSPSAFVRAPLVVRRRRGCYPRGACEIHPPAAACPSRISPRRPTAPQMLAELRTAAANPLMDWPHRYGRGSHVTARAFVTPADSSSAATPCSEGRRASRENACQS
jgi:hypothetical protein